MEVQNFRFPAAARLLVWCRSLLRSGTINESNPYNRSEKKNNNKRFYDNRSNEGKKKNEKERKNNEQFDDDRSEEERERINLVAMAMAEILWLLIIYMNEVGQIEFVGGTGVSKKSHSLIIDLHWMKFFCFKIFIMI